MVFKQVHEHRLKAIAERDRTRRKTGAEKGIPSQPPVHSAKGSNYAQLYYSKANDNSHLADWDYSADLFDAQPAYAL